MRRGRGGGSPGGPARSGRRGSTCRPASSAARWARGRPGSGRCGGVSPAAAWCARPARPRDLPPRASQPSLATSSPPRRPASWTRPRAATAGCAPAGRRRDGCRPGRRRERRWSRRGPATARPRRPGRSGVRLPWPARSARPGSDRRGRQGSRRRLRGRRRRSCGPCARSSAPIAIAGCPGRPAPPAIRGRRSPGDRPWTSPASSRCLRPGGRSSGASPPGPSAGGWRPGGRRWGGRSP